MAILITGGTGYIGSHTAAVLLEKGEQVIIADNLSNSRIEVLHSLEKLTGRKVPFYNIDLCNMEDIKLVFEDQPIDSVIHFAGLKAVGESTEKPLQYYKNNISGTLNLLETMRTYNCKKLIFSSSATVYGDPMRFKESLPESGIPETFPLDTTNPYGTTKLFIERILEDLWKADKSFKIAILRYFNPIGAHPSALLGEAPSGYPNNLSPYILDVLCGKRECLNVFGNDYNTKDGTGVRDYIHVMDLATGHIAALKKLKDPSDETFFIYNLGTGKGYSVIEVFKMFEKVSEREIPFLYAPRRAGDIHICFANPTKALDEMGWSAKHSLEDMCRSAWEWTLACQNPDC